MVAIRLLVILVSSAYLVLCNPISRNTGCKTIERRREWRDLSPQHRVAYTKAVLCLHSLPPREEGLATSRYDEFQLTHIRLTDVVHFNGQFLPWHRHLTTLFVTALREECGYDGPGVYVDWRRDYEALEAGTPLLKSPVFDPITGFGGTGVPGTYTIPPDPQNISFIGPGPWPEHATPAEEMWRGCVQDGPFRNFLVNLGPGKLITKHCIVRNVDEWFLRRLVNPDNVKEALGRPTYESFRTFLDYLPKALHGGAHGIIGGEMTNVYSSPADPIFYLVHAGLDKTWWDWQQTDPENRLYDLSGPSTVPGSPNITLDFELDFQILGKKVPVRAIMDTRQEPGCFEYV